MESKNKLQQFAKTSLTYFIGQSLSKLVTVFLLPLYTSRLIPEQLGMYDLAQTIINLIVPIAFVQIWDGAFRFAFDKEKQYEKHFLINNSLMVFLIGIIPFVVLLYINTRIFKLDYAGWILIYGLMYCLQYIYTFSARMYLDNKLFAGSGVACTVTIALVNILLIVKFNFGIESLYIAQIIGCIVQIIIIEIKLGIAKKFIVNDFDKTCILNMIRFTLPLCIATVSYWLLNGLTRVVINKRLGAYENGLFAVANKFATLVTFITIILQYAWNETVYIYMKEGGERQDYSGIISLFLKTMLYAGAGLCLAVKLVFPYLIDKQYAGAENIVPAVILGVAFNAVATLLNPLLMAEKKTSSIMISTLAGAAVNIVLSFAVSGRYGLQGISICLAAAFFVVMLIKLIELKRITDFKTDRTIVLDAAVCAVLIWLYFKLNSSLLIVLMLIITVLVYFMGIRKQIIPFIKSIRADE